MNNDDKEEPVKRAHTVFARRLEPKAALVKAYVSICLLAFVLFYIFLTVRNGFTLQCDLDTDICNFRYFSMVLAVMLLLPFGIESANVFYVIFQAVNQTYQEGSSPDILVSTQLDYQGILQKNGEVYNFLEENKSVVGRVVCGVLTALGSVVFLTLSVPGYLIYALLWGGPDNTRQAFFVSILLPEFYLTVLLFPLAVMVMNTSESLNDTLVNIVALQIFSQLDDLLVHILLRPSRSIGEVLDNYLTSTQKCEVMHMEGKRAWALSPKELENLVV